MGKESSKDHNPSACKYIHWEYIACHVPLASVISSNPHGGSMRPVLWVLCKRLSCWFRVTLPFRAEPGCGRRVRLWNPIPSCPRTRSPDIGTRRLGPPQLAQKWVTGWGKKLGSGPGEKGEGRVPAGWVEDLRKEEVQKKYCGKIC